MHGGGPLIGSKRPLGALDNLELLEGSIDRSQSRGAATVFLVGFFGSMAASLVFRSSTGLWTTLISALCPAVLVAFGVAALWSSVSAWAHRARSARCLGEFLRRQGVKPENEGDAGRIVAVVSGRALPHGGSRVVRVALSREAHRHGVVLHSASSGPYGRDQTEVGEAVLTADWIESILVEIDAAVAAQTLPELRSVRVGFPFRIDLYDSNLATPRVFAGNLCAGSWREHAAARLAHVVMRAAEAAGARRQPFGSCGPDGEVALGHR